MSESLNKQKILIVDDTAENIDILMGVLKSDYKLIAARSGEKALKMAQGNNPPDLHAPREAWLGHGPPDSGAWRCCRVYLWLIPVLVQSAPGH